MVGIVALVEAHRLTVHMEEAQRQKAERDASR